MTENKENLKKDEETLQDLEDIKDNTIIVNPDDVEEIEKDNASEMENKIDNEISKIDDSDNLDKEEQEKQKLEHSIKDQIYELDLKIEECEVKMDELENKILINPEDYDSEKEYLELKQTEKGYVKEKKALNKKLSSFDTSTLNKISVWVVIYGVLSIIISFPLITQILWFDAADFFINLLTGAFTNIDPESFLFYVIEFLIIFAFPLILNLITWLLYVNLVNSKTDKKAYIIMWIIQGAMSLGTIIYMCTLMYK